MEQGYMFGAVLFFLIVSVLTNIFLASMVFAKYTEDCYYKYEFEKSDTKLKMLDYAIGKSIRIATESWKETKVIPAGFEQCPNPTMITIAGTKEYRR